MTKTKINRTSRIFQLVLEGKTNEAILAIILKEYSKKEMGDKVANMSSVAWARTQLKAKTDYAKKKNPKGLKVLSNREAIAKTAKKPVVKQAVKASAAAA